MLEFQQCLDSIASSASIKELYEAAAWYAYEQTSRFKGVRVVSMQSIEPAMYKLAQGALLSAGVSPFIEGHERYVMPDTQYLSLSIEALSALQGVLPIRRDTLQQLLSAMHAHNLHTVRDIYNMSVLALSMVCSGHALYFTERLDDLKLYMPYRFKYEYLI
ncbi:MAG: hypothetical protein HKM02_08095 [Pseudomonadales bacterium]|nr:hypothetical protein [Pseudomonadales bacterium]